MRMLCGGSWSAVEDVYLCINCFFSSLIVVFRVRWHIPFVLNCSARLIAKMHPPHLNVCIYTSLYLSLCLLNSPPTKHTIVSRRNQYSHNYSLNVRTWRTDSIGHASSIAIARSESAEHLFMLMSCCDSCGDVNSDKSQIQCDSSGRGRFHRGVVFVLLLHVANI